MTVTSQESKQSCRCVLELWIPPFSTMLDVGTVPRVWYFFIFHCIFMTSGIGLYLLYPLNVM